MLILWKFNLSDWKEYIQQVILLQFITPCPQKSTKNSIQYKTQGFPSFSFVTLMLSPPPWILKRGGLGSYGQRPIFLNGKAKRVANIYIFSKFPIFWRRTHYFLNIYFKKIRFFDFILLFFNFFSLYFFVFLLKLLMLLLKVTEVTIEQRNIPKIS